MNTNEKHALTETKALHANGQDCRNRIGNEKHALTETKALHANGQDLY